MAKCAHAKIKRFHRVVAEKNASKMDLRTKGLEKGRIYGTYFIGNFSAGPLVEDNKNILLLFVFQNATHPYFKDKKFPWI